MTHVLGARSLQNLVGVHPGLVSVVEAAIAVSPIDFGVPEKSTRTLAEEQAKVAAGVSHTLKSLHIIQPDGFGHAVDLVPWISNMFTWARLDPFYEIAEAMRQAAIAKAVRIVWGGCWPEVLNDMAAGSDAIQAASAAYVGTFLKMHGRHPFIDAPHYQLAP